MPKFDLLCATIWGSGVLPGGFGGVPGSSEGLRGVPGGYGVFWGITGRFRDGFGGFWLGSGGVPGVSGWGGGGGGPGFPGFTDTLNSMSISIVSPLI